MHTIKGVAGFLGLEPIVETAHKAEDILGKLRNAEFVISPAINDLLLKAADKIREYLEKAENQEELEPDNELLTQLEDVLKNPNKYSDKYTTHHKYTTINKSATHHKSATVSKVLNSSEKCR
ncbi:MULTISPECIES: Hpt domain-containing protein [unclassified Hydrogenobaculum]|uniref:Hpt domain-containing protein n=1 Tax=unclassified Hydrogenobaculum TaxID=2622382 RepID=UPI0001C5032D|nr:MULTISPECIES: Hpt domain-containing protein [unclassified Hydrogenobaculum]AEF18605.1 Hpt protein [Hydrogenobaculum sp. 3684]AEG45893.1 Hpt protein [Hydrogenobaculum sp. SHO]AGG14536.1 putative CheA signal transduction histidine kinase [Hydrogenobaculum sp. HO]